MIIFSSEEIGISGPIHLDGQNKIVELVEGDCIKCGELCPPSIYCCTSPQPLTYEVAQKMNKKGGYRCKERQNLRLGNSVTADYFALN